MQPKNVDLGNNNIIIRQATIDDVVACRNAFSLMLGEIEDFQENDLIYSESNVSLFTRLVTESINLGFPPIIATNENKSIGFCLVIKLFGFETKTQTAQALGSYVYPKFRGLGISKHMLDYAFSFYKSKGVEKIYGKIFESRPSSNKVISNLGLEKIDVLCKIL